MDSVPAIIQCRMELMIRLVFLPLVIISCNIQLFKGLDRCLPMVGRDGPRTGRWPASPDGWHRFLRIMIYHILGNGQS
jgi:hypothetical protein